MSNFVFVKVECERVEVKEECVEEEDPLMITLNNETGTGDFMKKVLSATCVN